MNIPDAHNHLADIGCQAVALLDVGEPTDRDWQKLCELFSQFADEMDARELDPVEIVAPGLMSDAQAGALINGH